MIRSFLIEREAKKGFHLNTIIYFPFKFPFRDPEELGEKQHFENHGRSIWWIPPTPLPLAKGNQFARAY